MRIPRLVLALSGLVVAGSRLAAQAADPECKAPSDLWSRQPQHFPTVRAVPLRVGTYRLIMGVTGGRDSGSVATGSLDLWAVRRLVHPPNHHVTYQMRGASNIDLSRIGSPSVAYPVSSRAPDSAGVEVSYNAVDRTLSFDLGAAYLPGVALFDQGTVMWVLAADSSSVFGRWADAGLARDRPSGYFCIVPRA